MAASRKGVRPGQMSGPALWIIQGNDWGARGDHISDAGNMVGEMILKCRLHGLTHIDHKKQHWAWPACAFALHRPVHIPSISRLRRPKNPNRGNSRPWTAKRGRVALVGQIKVAWILMANAPLTSAPNERRSSTVRPDAIRALFADAAPERVRSTPAHLPAA